MDFSHVWDVDIGFLAQYCPNITSLSFIACHTSFMASFGEFPKLKTLEILHQRHVYGDDLADIGLNCKNLEEFRYTNEFNGKHSVSHDLLIMVYPEAFPKLKKFYTNDDTCSKRMILLIQQNKPDLQVFDSYYGIILMY